MYMEMNCMNVYILDAPRFPSMATTLGYAADRLIGFVQHTPPPSSQPPVDLRTKMWKSLYL
nr:hypothetical protein Q903MT_gene2236 [Picea sitchensis]